MPGLLLLAPLCDIRGTHLFNIGFRFSSGGRVRLGIRSRQFDVCQSLQPGKDAHPLLPELVLCLCECSTRLRSDLLSLVDERFQLRELVNQGLLILLRCSCNGLLERSLFLPDLIV